MLIAFTVDEETENKKQYGWFFTRESGRMNASTLYAHSDMKLSVLMDKKNVGLRKKNEITKQKLLRAAIDEIQNPFRG